MTQVVAPVVDWTDCCAVRWPDRAASRVVGCGTHVGCPRPRGARSPVRRGRLQRLIRAVTPGTARWQHPGDCSCGYVRLSAQRHEQALAPKVAVCRGPWRLAGSQVGGVGPKVTGGLVDPVELVQLRLDTGAPTFDTGFRSVDRIIYPGYPRSAGSRWNEASRTLGSGYWPRPRARCWRSATPGCRLGGSRRLLECR